MDMIIDESMTPLMKAASKGDIEEIRKLLKEGVADVNAKSSEYGMTALMYAAGNGHTEAIRELVKAGADVNARDNGQ